MDGQNREPTPIGNELDEILFRAIAPGIADEYGRMKRELKEIMDEIRERKKRTLRWLMKIKAKSEQYQELEEEVKLLVKYHTDRFKERLDALVDGLIADDSLPPPEA